MAYNNNDPFADLPDASADPFADLPDASSGGLAASFGSGVDKVQEIGYRALKGFTDVGENPNDYEEGSTGRWVAESIGQGGSLAKFADKGIARNLQEQQAYMPTVGSYKDVDSLGSAASYVGELTAGSIPYMGAALYPPTLFAMGGGLSNEAYEAQEDKSPLRAVASGYGQIALERIGALGSLGKIGGVAKDAATGKVKSVVKSALGEGATEAGQDALAQWGAGASIDELDVDSLQESFVGGAAVGGTIRTGTEAYNTTKEKIKPTLSDTETTDLLSDPEDAQTPVQQTVGGETVDYDPTIEPSAISPIEGETANDWRPNWEFGQNDMPINGQMQPYTYEGELDPFHDIPNSVPVGQVLEAPIIEGEFERPRGLPDRSNVIYGEDGRPMQQAQEFAQQAANNYQPKIEQKDIIFAGDNRGVQLKQDGTPFGGKKAVSISKGFKDANAKGLNPSVVQVNGGYGWVAENDNAGLASVSGEMQRDQQVRSAGDSLPHRVRGEESGRLRDDAREVQSVDGADQALGDANGQYENALSPNEKGVIEAPVSELKLSDDIPQFKSGADQDGVVEPLTGKYDPVGMAPIQVWVRSNGDKEIITGRHRFDLAKRAGVDNIPAQYHYEDEGFTAEDGKRTDAILNIREDKGQVEDYVELFQQDKLTEEDAKELGLLDRATGRTAYRIASSATRETVEAQRSGRITGQAAERIAETAPKDEALQSLALKALMNDQRSITYAENLIRAVKSMRKDNGPEQQTGDLFGFDDSAMREAEDMAKVAATKQRELRTRLNAIRGAAKNPKLAKAEGVNVKDPKSLNKRIEEISTQAKAWDNWETKPELVSEIRNEIGASPLDAESKEQAKVEQPESIVDENQDSLFGEPETETERFAREKVEQSAKDEAAAKAKTESNKIDADKDVDSFSLAGSDRISDVGATNGQDDLFGQPITKEKQSTGTVDTVADNNQDNNKNPDEFKINDIKLYGHQQAEVEQGGNGLAGELNKDVVSSLVSMRNNKKVPSVTYETLKNVEWVDIGNGATVRGYNLNGNITQDIKLPSGMIMTRRLSLEGRLSGDIEGNASQILDGEGQAEIGNFLKDFYSSKENSKTEQLADKGNKTFSGGEIQYVSHPRKEVKINDLWYDFDSIVKADKPAEFKEPTKPLSTVVESVNKSKGKGLTDADKIPAQIEPTLESYNSFMDRVDNADESLTAKDVLDAFKVMRNGVEAIEAELNTMTKEKILKYYRGYDRNGKKAGLAKSAASSMVTDFGFVTTSTGMMTTSGIGREERFNSVQKKLEALTDTDLQNNMKAVKAEQEKRISDMKKRISGAKDPKTLDDFRNAVRIGVSDEFTPEQWAQYDKLHADEKLEQQEKAAVKTVSAVNDDVTYTTAETVHSKNGTPLYVVSLGDRVPSELYKELNAKSKSLGGYYSRYSKDGAIPGFQFKSESDRKNFLSLLEGNEVTKTKEDKDKTESLEALADRIEERATGVVNQDRKTNTSRRASMAAGVISNAEAELSKASELRLLATAIKNGEAKYLSKLSTGTERDLIASLWNRLRYNVKGAQADNLLERETINGNARGYKWKQGVSPEQKVRFAEYPLTSMRADSVKRIAQEMMKAKGYKQAAMKFIADAGKLSESDTMNVAGHKYNNKFMQFVRENQDNTYIEDVVKDYSRLARMGITTTPMLRAALLEYNSITDNAKPVKVKNATTEKLKYSSLQGKYKENDFFNSTDTVVETAVNVADIQPGMKVLEPSAGAGHLADGVANVVGIENVKTFELASGLQKFLTDKGYDVTGGDFLEQTPTGDFDRVVMNPPFSKDQEITHIEHAYKFLKPGGRLVAVTSSMAGNRSNKRNKAFLSWMKDIGASEYNLPAGSFKDAINPTDVNSKIIVIDKPAQDTMFKRSDSFTDNSNASTTGNTGAVTLKDANKVIDGIVSNWDGDNRANDFVIAESFEQLPTNIKDAAKQQGAEGQVKGVFHNGKTYLVLDQHTSTTELEETIYHETYGHQGLRKMYGPDLPKKLNQLFVAIGGISGLRVTAKRNGVNLSAYEKGLQQAGTRKDVANQILMDELLAHMQQSNKPSVKRFAMEAIGLIRSGLRKMGFAKLAKLNDADLFHILRKSRKAVQTDGKSNSGESDVMFSRTNPEESPFILPEETKQERAIRFVQDKLNRVKKAQKVVGESGINTSDSADVYGKESLYYGKVEENFRQLSQEYIEPIADKLAKADIPQVEFDLYLYALHAKERNAYISTINEGMESGSGMTNQEADAIIAAVNASPKRKAFRDTNRMVRSMIDKRVESMRDAGIIDEETFASLQDSYENYVPLKGQAKDEGGKPKGTGMGFNIKGKETIAALGRQSKAESPLLHSFIDTQEAIVRGHKNEVGNAMLKLIEEAPNPDLWNAYTTEGPTKREKDSSGKVVEKAMSASTMSALASSPMSEWFTTKRDGVTHYMKFEDPLIAQQMKSFGVDNGNAITRTLGMVNRYLSMMSTSLNPEFLVTNLVRDVQTAVFNIAAETEIADGKIKGLDANKFAKQSLKDLPKAFKGIRSVLRDNNTDSEWSQVFDQFRKNGAKTGYFDMKDLEGQERDLKNLMKLESKSQVMKFKDGALKFIEDYNSSVENAIRLSVYKNALDNGISQHKAAVLAKNLTVNFNRKGEAGTWLNSLFLFANAGIQGTANFARAIGTFKVVDGKKKLNLAQKAGIAMAGIAFSMSVMNRMISDDDDDGESYWDKIPEHVKERNFVLMHPNGKDYFTLPMPYGYNVFANMGTAAESLMSGGKVSENAAFLVKAVMGSFVPLGLSEGNDALETTFKTLTPQIGKPFVDIMTNTNFFGSQIYSDANNMYGDKRSDSALGRDKTNEIFKTTAKGLNSATGGTEYQEGGIDVHPETLRYIAEYLGGGAGATVLRTAETIARGTKGEFEASKTPFIRKVYGKLTDYSDQTDFYNRADEVSKYKAEFSSLRGKERYEFKKENEDLIRLEPMADQTKKSLKQLRNRKKLLAKREGAEEKIKQIDEKMETLVDRFNKRYNEAMEKR